MWCVVMVGALWFADADRAQAQIPWFNGGGVSVGGGTMRFEGGGESPLTALIRPDDDSVGAIAGGAFLALGTDRWALMLPEFHAIEGASEGELVPGTLTLGTRSLAFEPRTRGFGAYAVLVGGQATLIPGGRVWVRGGIGSGWISSRIESEDPNVGIDLSDDIGLALSGAAGVSVWRRSVGTNPRGTFSLDAEVDYLRVAGDDLRISAPSLRVGLRIQANCLHGRCP
jgi:hypothetical protein